MTALSSLAAFLGMHASQLERFVGLPLPASAESTAFDKIACTLPDIYRALLAVSDGLTLFPGERHGSLRLWRTSELRSEFDYVDDIVIQSAAHGFVPILGETPHLTSLRFSDGAVIATDWENDVNSDAWGRQIAPDLQTFVQTAIHIYQSSDNIDWVHSYAFSGVRHDHGES